MYMLSDSVTTPTANRTNNPIAQAMFMIVSITGKLSLNISSGMPGKVSTAIRASTSAGVATVF